MKIENSLREKLTAALAPEFLELNNESHMHGLPSSAEKHFRLVAVSPKFKDMSRVERHRHVNAIVAEELKNHVHAFSVQAYTPEEWSAKQGKAHESPECLGGSKHEAWAKK